jgi:hypothetical protein
VGWLKTTQGMLTAVATVLAIIGAWWQLGLPREVFSDELAPRAPSMWPRTRCDDCDTL